MITESKFYSQMSSNFVSIARIDVLECNDGQMKDMLHKALKRAHCMGIINHGEG